MPIFHRHTRQELDALVEEYTTRHTLSRRVFLQRATAAGLSASAASALLASCGDSPSIDAMTEWGPRIGLLQHY